jgi:AsmA protein
VAGFRLRFEGQTSLDGKLNLKMRIGLPPLGILGIPIKVLGTQENPNIKLGRKSEDLEETEYVDGITPINTTEGLPGPATVVNDSVPKIEPAIPVEKID